MCVTIQYIYIFSSFSSIAYYYYFSSSPEHLRKHITLVRMNNEQLITVRSDLQVLDDLLEEEIPVPGDSGRGSCHPGHPDWAYLPGIEK